MATKNIKVKTICIVCHIQFDSIYVDSFSTAKCPGCLTIYPITRTGSAIVSSTFFKKHKDVVAFGVDTATGREVAIDTKGRRIDPEETRYTKRDDPHGWRATGKKVKGFARK